MQAIARIVRRNVCRQAAFVVAMWAAGAGATATAGEVPSHFKPLAFLLGPCWRGTFADGKRVDIRCVEPEFGGTFIRERHVVRGPGMEYRGEALYHWDAEAGQIRFTYWNSDGGVSTGAMEVTGTKRVFPTERYKTADGKTREFRTTWNVQSNSSWVAVTEERKGDRWVEAWRVTYERDEPGARYR
jgi:hypothetical protein